MLEEEQTMESVQPLIKSKALHLNTNTEQVIIPIKSLVSKA